ncbi:MAG: glucosaminidase domain-containing protein [Bacteroidetes bacterium]|nr:glucosaminidase domain-containing protein [Bacteroidota bacterium]
MKKSVLILCIFYFIHTYLFSQNTASLPQQYIEKYKVLAINEMIRTGVPAAITLAQGILESGSGQSDLAIRSNNHFGIKCKLDWTGDKVYQDDDEANECFRSYPTVEDSYRDHSDFLKTRPNYAFLFSIPATDYKGWCYGLKKAGYATSPSYPTLLIDVISKYNLQQYTLDALQRMQSNNLASTKQNSLNDMPIISVTKMENENLSYSQQSKSVNNPADIDVSSIMATEEPASNYPSGIFLINQCKVIYATAGSSLFAISAQQNIDFAKLLSYNEMESGDILENGMLIYLQKKGKKSNIKKFHITTGTESLTDIAQNEGVQLQSILAYNHLTNNQKIEPGTKILLQPPTNQVKGK